jgi:hypothetical protein
VLARGKRERHMQPLIARASKGDGRKSHVSDLRIIMIMSELGNTRVPMAASFEARAAHLCV